MRRRVLLVALLLCSRPLLAADADDAELRARTFFAAGDYRQALDIYVQLYAQTMHPTYIRNIGRCYQNLGEPDRALNSFREYLRKARDLTPEARAEVDGYIREMEELKRRNAGASPPPPAPAAQPAPAAGLSLAPSPEHAPDVDQARPITTRWWFWTALGVVAAGGVITAVALSSSKAPPATPTMPTTFGTMTASF